MEAYFATVDPSSSNSRFLNILATTEDGEKQIISYINTHLNTAKTRLKALNILIESLPNLSPDLVSEHVLSWLKYCIVQHSQDALSEIKLLALTKLIPYTRSKQDFDKTFTSEYLPKILEMCLGITFNHNHSKAALECLSVCLICYPNWFNPHLRRIENFLLKFLDCMSEEVTMTAATVFLYLQQSGAAGLDKINYITNYARSFKRLIQTANKLLDNLTDVTELDTSEEHTILPYNLSPLKRPDKITQRLLNIVTFLIIMRKGKFSTRKTVDNKSVLDFVMRGMEMHICLSSQEVANEDWNKSTYVQIFQSHLLYFLKIYVLSVGHNVFPFTYIITRMLVDMLVRSDKCKCFKLDKSYQENLYSVFIEFINVTKGILSIFQDKVFRVLINNIAPVSDEVRLNLDSKSQKEKSKKFKRKMTEDTLNSFCNQRSNPQLQNLIPKNTFMQNNAQMALRTATSILKAMPEGIDEGSLNKLFRIITDIASTGLHKAPYSNIQCQVDLYEAVMAFLEQDHLSYSHLCVINNILIEGKKNPHVQVSVICENGLRISEKICQPACLPLVKKSSKEVSEKEITMLDDSDNILENENGESTCNSDDDESDNKINKDDESKKIQIVDIQIVKPADTNGDVSNRETEEDSRLNGHDCNSLMEEVKDEQLETIQIDDSEGEVEFIKEQIILSDETENDISDEVKVIETVNEILSDTQCVGIPDKSVEKIKPPAPDDETPSSDTECAKILDKFVEEITDMDIDDDDNSQDCPFVDDAADSYVF